MKKSIGIIFLSILLITCKNHILDNPVDPEAENYVGFESIDSDGDGIGSYDDIDEIFLRDPKDKTVIIDMANTILEIQFLNPEVVSTYRIQISTDSDFISNIIIDDSSLTSNKYNVPSGILNNNTNYYWRAMAFDGTRWSNNWSSISSFFIDMEEPTLLYPNNNQTINSLPILDWNDVATASKYEIQVSSDSDFNDIVETANNTTQSQYQVTSILSNNTNYYWRVRIQNEDKVYGDWSDVLSFHMDIVFTKHIVIAASSRGIGSVYASDIDSDGDIDVIGVAREDDAIIWWENDGNENFTEHIISDNFDYACSVYASDINGDGHIDIIGAAAFADAIAWWENDGNENFTKHVIDSTFDQARSVYAIDIDADGDMDVIGAALSDSTIAWWENAGDGVFTMHTISTNFAGAYSAYASDIDCDGDIDVIGAGYYADALTWWENDGNENFVEHTITDSFDGAVSVHVNDMDGDGDIDVIGAANEDDTITWWENDGNENFTEHIISDNFDYAYSVYTVDIGNDGDIDVIGAANVDDTITWWENDGNENFSEHILDTFNVVINIYADDIDSDGDIDLLGSWGGITWLENSFY